MYLHSPNWFKLFWFDYHSTKGYHFLQIHKFWIRYEKTSWGIRIEIGVIKS